ncbi:DNA topoisomerase [Streptococcus gallolyticus]|uniref:type IA DNA topoisomerase n=1 Tax=Streptococcus gallolyticus TaxID=315405 RepID=UPI001F3F6522|nr:type IA DNA topoisomerase [Streptococcus gallolyticus]MCF1634070.1 DNA topoisomerase [Streptococcus gallolyticus]
MSTVILAEKPSQALAYASSLKQSTKKDGYFEIKDPLFTDETFITFGFGHLVELAEPGHYDEKWQNWKLESLPIFPDRYDFEVAKDKGKQFKIVAELLKKANTIIVATDSDREGENIAWSIIHKAIAMFLPDYLYEETKIQTKVADLLFQSIGKTPKQEGWKILFKQQTKEEKEDVQTLPLVIIGERAEVGVKSVEKETQPPKAFTEGTLLTAMKTANKTVDDEEAIKILQEVEGIGTEATRASIIEALKQKEYIQVIKNKLVVTEKGKLLCQAVESQHLLTSAEMTAKWETYLKKIGKREGNQENFITNIKKFIVHLLEAVPNDIEKLNFSDYQEQKEKEAEKSIVGKCPKCGNNIVLKKSFYGCSNYPECKFTLAEHFRKKKLTKTNVKELLEGKETLVKGIKNKEKKPYNAVVKIGEKGYIDFISFSK